MPKTEIDSATYSTLRTAQRDYEVSAMTTDSALDQKETEWNNSKWTQQLGYYKQVDLLRNTIDALARWSIGKGYKTNPITELLLMKIKGNGKDTFNSIMQNMVRVMQIGGDAYAEIIRDKEDYLINLKPLSPEYMYVILNPEGIIRRYEYRFGAKIHKFDPDEIFHLSRNRTADEIHGVSMIDALEENIKASKEVRADTRKLMHRYVKPMRLIKLDEDNETKIAAFKTKVEKAIEDSEILYVPKDIVEHELLTVPANATLNPQAWINRLNQDFYQAGGVPQIVVGGAQEITEATAKILYLSWEQTIEEIQLFLEEQTLSQLNLEIEYTFPASLQNEMLSSVAKQETMQATTPEDTSVRFEGYGR